jgi:3-hydroxybutyryl-CoA dehydratase
MGIKQKRVSLAKIGDTVVVTVTVAELLPEKTRARLFCQCEVDGSQ